MNLKKINSNLRTSIEGYGEEISPLLEESFATLKSGTSILQYSPNEKELVQSVAFSVIQKVDGFQSDDFPKAVILCEDFASASRIKETIERLLHHSKLRVFITKDALALDADKDKIAEGIDVLIGSPHRLSQLFSAAGFDGNRLKLVVIHDICKLLKLRKQIAIQRLEESMNKCQYLLTTTSMDEKTEHFIEKLLPVYHFYENAIKKNEKK